MRPALVFLLAALSGPAMAETILMEQLEAPLFTLRASGGRGDVRLDQFRGKVVMVNFWQAHCGWCKKQFPDLVHLQGKYGRKGFQVVGVSFDRQGDYAAAPIRQQFALNFPVGLDTNQAVADAYAVRGTPTSVLVNRKGLIAKRYPGYYPLAELEADVRSVL